MNLEERVKKLEEELEEMRMARDVVFSESIKKHITFNLIESGVHDTTLTDINTTTEVASTPSYVTHASPYDRRLRIKIDGATYYIGLYNE
jgi:hypothetical protein